MGRKLVVMDDDSRLAELAAGPLDDDDAAILAGVRHLYSETDPVPTDLVDRVLFSVALDEMFDEVAQLTRVPMEASAVRGADVSMRTETLTFSADSLTAMVTVTRAPTAELRLDGWLSPPAAYRVHLRIQGGGEAETRADAEGRFGFAGLDGGLAQLSFYPVPAEPGQTPADLTEDPPDPDEPGAATHTVITPVFEL
jgi:hypothetical protein